MYIVTVYESKSKSNILANKEFTNIDLAHNFIAHCYLKKPECFCTWYNDSNYKEQYAVNRSLDFKDMTDNG